MDKIVGKYGLMALILMHGFFAHADISLRVRDGNGRQVKEVVVGEPFILEVVLDGEHGSARNPTVEGLHFFAPAGRQTKMQTINGVTTFYYLYTLTAKKTGTYEIGPAETVYNGSKIKSKPLKIVAVEEASSRSLNNSESVVMRLMADKTRVVVGESIQCSLRLLCDSDSIVIQEVNQPEWQGFVVNSLGDPTKGTQEINGIQYNFVEWSWRLYAEKSGRIVIPATAVNFKEPVDGQESSFAHFSFFFSQRYKNRRVYSNQLTFDVDQLPAYAGQMHGVGLFFRFKADLKPSVAKQGEGMVLTLSLVRSYDSHLMKNPELVGIPQGLCAYHSRNYVVDQQNGLYLECIEYVMQGIKAGDWEIPEQTFTYFDIDSHTYKTLRTESILVTIFPSASNSEQPVKNNMNGADDNQIIIEDADNDQEIRPLNTKGLWYYQAQKSIPWFIFLIIVIAPIVSFLAVWFRKKWKYRINRRQPITNKKRAFVHARSALKKAEKNGLYAEVYPIFVSLFGSRGVINPSDNVHEKITRTLLNAGMPHDEYLAWDTFFSYSAQQMFFKKNDLKDYDYNALFKQAYEWLVVLEKII